MKFVMNSLDEEQTILAHGKHFFFKARQVKPFYSDAIGAFILKERAELGMIEVPAIVNDDEGAVEDYVKDPKVLEERRKAGVEAYCVHLRKVLYNLQVSLRKDLDSKNMKMDVRTLATSGDLNHMEKLVKYQTRKEDAEQVKVDRIKQLEKALEGK